MDLNVRLIVPAADGGTILLDATGRLPAVSAPIGDDEASIVAVDAVLRDAWSDPAPVLETHPRWEGVPDDEPVPTLVLTEPARAGWVPPAGLAFSPIPTTIADLPDQLVPRATELLEELRTGAAPPPLRPRWARRGWFARASAWMAAAARDAGSPLTGEPWRFYLRGISALLRAPTAGRDLFLKAVFPPFHAEPVLTELLAGHVPDAMPRILAIEPDEGWLLVEDVAGPWIGNLPADEKSAGLTTGMTTLIRIQRDMAGRTAELDALVAAGAPRRPLSGLVESVEAAVGEEGLALAHGPLEDARRDRLLAGLAAAVDRVAGLGLPETVVHGDFHPGNVALVDGRPVVIDWSDAAIGNPMIDLVTWQAWSEDREPERQAAVDAWVDGWAPVAGAEALREHVDDALLIGAAYQLVSYDGIMRGLEPATRYTMAGAADHYLERAEALLPPTA